MSKAYELFMEGKKLYKEKKFLKAVMFFERSKKIEPERGSIRELLAASYYNLGFIKASKDNFAKALDIDKCNDYAHFGLSLCFAREGDRKKALGHIKLASAMRPENELYKKTLRKIQD